MLPSWFLTGPSKLATSPHQTSAINSVSMHHYHSPNLIYDFCSTKHDAGKNSLAEFGLEGWVWGVSSGELVLISATLLREKLLVWKWRASLWSAALYIWWASLPRGVGWSICVVTLHAFPCTKDTLTDLDASTHVSRARTGTQRDTRAPTAKLCSWPKTASFSSSLLFWAVGSSQLQEARLWCCTPSPS